MASISLDGIEAESTVVLYEPRSGRIVHVHHVVTIRGATHPDATEIERSALAQLSPALSPGKLLALHVSPEEFTARRLLRVDPQTMTLLKLPVQPSHPDIKIR
jgi:hypothetical protein